MADLTPWATSFRYPARDPLTAVPVPSKTEIETRLAEAETFVEAVGAFIAPPKPGAP